MGRATRIAGVSAPGAASAPAPAPNVTAATASVFFQPWANAQQFGFTGTISLPTVQTYLKRIDVMAFDPGGIGHLVASFTSWGASPVSYSGVVGLQPSSAQTWSVQFICYNAAGTPTPSPYTVSGISVAAPTLTSVTGREVPNSLATDPSTRLVETTIGITPVFPTAQLPHIGTYLVSRDNGVTFVWVGWQQFTAAGQEVTCMQVKPQAAQSWKVAVIPYAYPWDASIPIPAANLPTGAVVSASFTVGALGLPSATDITSLTVGTGSGPAANPYNGATSDGAQYFSIGGIGYDEAGARSDPNAFFVRITAQDLDANHNAIGPEQAYAGTGITQDANSAQTFPALVGQYLTGGYGYTRTGNIAYVRLKVYACNRVDQTATAWSNPLCATLQTGVKLNGSGGAADHIDLLVATGGTPPPGKLVGTNLNPATLGPGVIVGPSSPITLFPSLNTLRIGTSNLTTGAFYDESFYFLGGTFPGLVVLGSEGLWNFYWFGTGTATMKTDGGHDDAYYCRLTGKAMAVGQVISVSPGEQLNASVWVKSNNPTVGGGETHALLLYYALYDNAGAHISSTVIATATGYMSAWTQLAGYSNVIPAGACYAYVFLYSSATEPAAGYWDVDTFFVQHVSNQTGNGQTASMAPTVISGDQSALHTFSATDPSSSFYGKNLMYLTAPDGVSTLMAGVGSGMANVGCYSGSGAAHRAIGFVAESGGICYVIVTNGTNSYPGWTGLVAGRSSVGGIVI